jgi:hypothetical protein
MTTWLYPQVADDQAHIGGALCALTLIQLAMLICTVGFVAAKNTFAPGQIHAAVGTSNHILAPLALRGFLLLALSFTMIGFEKQVDKKKPDYQKNQFGQLRSGLQKSDILIRTIHTGQC